MADTKITGLTELAATPASNDWYVVTDVSDTTMDASGTNKKLSATRVVHKDTSGNVAVLGNFSVGTATAGAVAHISSPIDEVLRLSGTAATSNPYISFYQGTTRRSYVQHVDTNDTLNLVSEYGNVSIKAAATLGTDSEAEYITVKAGGNVGIGTASPSTKLQVHGTFRISSTNESYTTSNWSKAISLVGGYVTTWTKNGGTYSHGFGATNSGFYWMRSASDDATASAIYDMVITDNGDVGIGNVGPSYKLDVNGAAHASSFPTSSDRRLKENITPLKDVFGTVSAVDKLKQLNGYTFTWKDEYRANDQFYEDDISESDQEYETLPSENPEPDLTVKPKKKQIQIGLIAQEVRQVFPELVSKWKHDGNDGKTILKTLAVDYGRFVPILIEAIKELDRDNKQLRNRVKALEAA